jgi:hypothetical protein
MGPHRNSVARARAEADAELENNGAGSGLMKKLAEQACTSMVLEDVEVGTAMSMVIQRDLTTEINTTVSVLGDMEDSNEAARSDGRSPSYAEGD